MNRQMVAQPICQHLLAGTRISRQDNPEGSADFPVCAEQTCNVIGLDGAEAIGGLKIQGFVFRFLLQNNVIEEIARRTRSSFCRCSVKQDLVADLRHTEILIAQGFIGRTAFRKIGVSDQNARAGAVRFLCIRIRTDPQNGSGLLFNCLTDFAQLFSDLRRTDPQRFCQPERHLRASVRCNGQRLQRFLRGAVLPGSAVLRLIVLFAASCQHRAQQRGKQRQENDTVSFHKLSFRVRGRYRTLPVSAPHPAAGMGKAMQPSQFRIRSTVFGRWSDVIRARKQVSVR